MAPPKKDAAADDVEQSAPHAEPVTAGVEQVVVVSTVKTSAVAGGVVVQLAPGVPTAVDVSDDVTALLTRGLLVQVG